MSRETDRQVSQCIAILRVTDKFPRESQKTKWLTQLRVVRLVIDAFTFTAMPFYVTELLTLVRWPSMPWLRISDRSERWLALGKW